MIRVAVLRAGTGRLIYRPHMTSWQFRLARLDASRGGFRRLAHARRSWLVAVDHAIELHMLAAVAEPRASSHFGAYPGSASGSQSARNVPAYRRVERMRAP
jgi:hypothetical protein